MEVAVLHSPSLLVRRVSVDVEQHWTSEAPTLPPTALNKHSVHRVRHCYSFNKHPTHNVYINKGSEIIVNAMSSTGSNHSGHTDAVCTSE